MQYLSHALDELALRQLANVRLKARRTGASGNHGRLHRIVTALTEVDHVVRFLHLLLGCDIDFHVDRLHDV